MRVMEISPAGPSSPEKPVPLGARPALAEALRESVLSWLPERAHQLSRRARAEARALAVAAIPLPLYEVWKLGSLDPFVPRATSLSFRTSGRHFLVLAGYPMTDSGGGHRPAQLARELLHRAHRVTYVHRFRSRERGRRRRSYAHENLTHVRFEDFSARRFAKERASSERIVVLTEAPLPEYLACARYLKAQGAQTAYDCMDDWSSSLGGSWYSPRTEDAFIRESGLVVASARALKDHLEGRSWREVALLPNAADTRLFARSRELARPGDLPSASAVFLYAGSLSGSWFDWGAVTALARSRPDAAVVLVGEYRGQCRNPPRNLHFLGLKAHSELPAYVAHADVCLVPYKADRMTRSVSPVKVFEYLAMGKPVVASDLPELQELPGVTLAHNEHDFADKVTRAQGTSPDPDLVAKFVAENSWKARVRRLERLLSL